MSASSSKANTNRSVGPFFTPPNSSSVRLIIAALKRSGKSFGSVHADRGFFGSGIIAANLRSSVSTNSIRGYRCSDGVSRKATARSRFRPQASLLLVHPRRMNRPSPADTRNNTERWNDSMSGSPFFGGHLCENGPALGFSRTNPASIRSCCCRDEDPKKSSRASSIAPWIRSRSLVAAFMNISSWFAANYIYDMLVNIYCQPSNSTELKLCP